MANEIGSETALISGERPGSARSSFRPLRVVHLSSVHSAFDIRIFHKECKSLARAGHHVTFVVPHAEDVIVDGVHIKAVSRNHRRFSRMTRTVARVFRKAVREPADIYHFHDPELIPIALLLRAQGKRVIYDIHEDVPRDIISKHYLGSWARKPLGWLVQRIEDWSSGRFSALITVTPDIANRFRSLNRNVVMVRNFPQLKELAAAAHTGWDKREPAVAYVGGILVERGIREMVHAMALLPETLAARLKIAHDDFPPNFRQELQQHPGWRRVEDCGLLDRSGISRLLGQVRAGLVLFHPEPNNVAAMPHKLFEYMAAGIPVIASDFPLWRKIISQANCGFLVNPQDPAAVARAIEFVLTHPREAAAMGQCGRRAVEALYNWENEERTLLQLYAELSR
jgi:glycosyltransferase involved in cell wall biosynthesis